MIYVAVNAGMVVAWLTARFALEAEGGMWFLPTVLGWGAALAIHRYVVRRAWSDSSAA